MGMELVRRAREEARNQLELVKARNAVRNEVVLVKDRVDAGYDLAHYTNIRSSLLDHHVGSLTHDRPFLEADLRQRQATLNMSVDLAILSVVSGRH